MVEKKKRGPGRPRQLEDRKRVVAFVSGHQYKVLRRFAEAQDQTISETVRGFIEDAEPMLAWLEESEKKAKAVRPRSKRGKNR